MTLTQLAQKHNLEPENARDFLREWFDMQDSYIVQGRSYPNVCRFYSRNMQKGDVLIARPNMEDL